MFSEKYVNQGEKILQTGEIDNKLRIDLWNSVQSNYLNRVFGARPYSSIADPYINGPLRSCRNSNIILDLYENYFILPINNLFDFSLYGIKKEVENLYNELPWFKVYDLIEFIATRLKDDNFDREINFKLERNNSAYRLINREICPITNETEIMEISKAANTKYDSVNSHIDKAIQLFGDRNNPDYENTIKESITAVETMCSVIVGKQAALSEALKELENRGVVIHPALKQSFIKLYGYTSDANGIRHAGDIGGKNSTFAEAKFMLVSCSAFINYLIENMQHATK